MLQMASSMMAKYNITGLLWVLVVCVPSSVLANRLEVGYQSLLATESELAGDVAFDLHFGAVALDANDPGAAVFAFQRVLAQQPGNAEAHLGIARAYFDLGEDSSARRHFDLLYAVSDRETKAYIKTYLGSLDARAGLRRPTTVAYAGLNIGYDDNITQIRDGQPPGTLGAFAIQSSKFSGLVFGARHQRPINAIWHWQLGANGDFETHHDFDGFDKSRLKVNGGVGGRIDAWRWNLDLSSGEIRRDNENLYSKLSASAVLENRVDGFWKKAGFRLLQRDYGSAYSVRDVDGYELILGARHAGRQVRWSDVGVDLNIGDESAKNDPNDAFGRDYVTARFRWYLMPHSQVRVGVGYDYSKSEFDNVGVQRQGDFRSALVKMSVANIWRDGLELNAQISRDQNNSNTPTLTYDRNRISVGLRYNWGI
jgi:hypothetical protein